MERLRRVSDKPLFQKRKQSFNTLVSLLLLLFSFPLTSFAGSVQLPQTGQTTSYATGDDGDLERGVAWPVPRFTDQGDGTVMLVKN